MTQRRDLAARIHDVSQREGHFELSSSPRSADRDHEIHLRNALD